MEWLRKIEIPNRGGGPYLDRWPLVPRNRWCNVYLHRFWSGDDIRFGLHDHPWNFISIVLAGAYREIFRDGTEAVRRRLSVAFRTAETAHAVFVSGGGRTWSLVLTGPIRRDWGFYTSVGWRSEGARPYPAEWEHAAGVTALPCAEAMEVWGGPHPEPLDVGGPDADIAAIPAGPGGLATIYGDPRKSGGRP